MANSDEILEQINVIHHKHMLKANAAIDTVRNTYLRQLSEKTGRNVIAYYSGFLSRPGVQGTEINDDDMNSFMSCINGLDRKKGLDLLLHTPGGGIAATEAIVNYLHLKFSSNIRAIVPHMAMSAGTMIALSCKSIVMGAHSSLGPIDPHIDGISAALLINEFKRAHEEIKADTSKLNVWHPILSKYPPTILDRCEHAIKRSKEFVRTRVKGCMLYEHPSKKEISQVIVDWLSDPKLTDAHDKHINILDLKGRHVAVDALEDDQQLQDAVLSVHHCFIHSLSNSNAIKIVSNQNGKASIRLLAS